MKNKLYEVTIKDENGKIVHSVKSDCIVAALSNPLEKEVAGVFMTNCSSATIAGSFATIEKIKKHAFEQNPMLMLMELSDLMRQKEEMEKEVAGGVRFCRLPQKPPQFLSSVRR